MATVTQKYNDPIEQAKSAAIAQYNTKKLSLVPTEIVDLTSKGRFYPIGHPLRSGKIEMRYMTAYDEDIIMNSSYIKNGIAVDKLLEALIVDPNISLNSILQCDKDALVIAARILSYGKQYDVQVSHDNNLLKRTVDLSMLEQTESTLITDEHGIVSYQLNDNMFKFKMLTIEEYDIIKKSDKPLFDFLTYSVVQINDIKNLEQIKEFLQYSLLVSDSKQLRTYILDNTPKMNLMVQFEDDNGGIFKAGFQIRSDFFYP